MKQQTRQLYQLQDIEQHKDLLEGHSGIYALLFVSNNIQSVIYIGQSNNLYRRLKEHLRNTASQRRRTRLYRYLKDNLPHIQFLYVEYDVCLLNQLEQQYIEEWQPIFNIQGRFSAYRGVRRPHEKSAF